MTTPTEKLAAAALKTLLAEREVRLASIVANRALAKLEALIAERCKANALTCAAEKDVDAMQAFFDSVYDHVVKSQNAEAQVMSDQKFLETIERNIKKDGGASLARKWYTKEGQEEAEGLLDSRAAAREEARR